MSTDFPMVISHCKQYRPRKKSYSLNFVIIHITFTWFIAEFAEGTKFVCIKEGKFKDPENEERYHQCFTLYGSLRYIRNICPLTTCFNEVLNHCTPCSQGVSPPMTPPPHPSISYDCSNRRITCNKRGIFGVPGDHSIYIKCETVGEKLVGVCYSCNRKRKTCFSNTIQACVTPKNGTKCEDKDPEVDFDPTNTQREDLIRKTTTYDCDGYLHRPPCFDLGAGMHNLPGDKSVYWKCIKDSSGHLVAQCEVCPKADLSVFVPSLDKCVSNGGFDIQHMAYDCSTYGNLDFPCNTTGYFTNSDSSVFFQCTRTGTKFFSECYSCNSNEKTCFLESETACVTFKGENCPSKEELEDKVSENNKNDTEEIVGTPEDSLTYDCSGYNSVSFPCSNYGAGRYAHPGDKSIYFVCEKNEKWVAQCVSCEEDKCFDSHTKQCLKSVCEEGDSGPKPYNCSSYGPSSFPCSAPGYYSGINDSSVYFQCVSNPNGEGLFSLCYTCSKAEPETCFLEGSDGKSGYGCVTTQNEQCGTKNDLENDEGKGEIETSRTYSCTGYTNMSFPCHSYPPGYYPIPGDPSVFIKCGRPTSNRSRSSFEKCLVCPKSLNACYIPEKRMCVKDCGRPSPPPLPRGPYDCFNRVYPCTIPGFFADPLDTSVYYQCKGERRAYKSLCYTCSSTSHTCFDESQLACVSNSGRRCGTTGDLEKNRYRGIPENSRTYSCRGYNNNSFPCEDHEEGYYPMPGDLSVYVKCEKIVSATGSSSSIYASCSSCSKKKKSCFIQEQMMCIENCGRQNVSESPDICTYNNELLLNDSSVILDNCHSKIKGKWRQKCLNHCSHNNYSVPNFPESPEECIEKLLRDSSSIIFDNCHSKVKGKWRQKCLNHCLPKNTSAGNDTSDEMEENKWTCNYDSITEAIKSQYVLFSNCHTHGYGENDYWKHQCVTCELQKGKEEKPVKSNNENACSNDAEKYLFDQTVRLCHCHPQLDGAWKSKCLSSCMACNKTESGSNTTETSDLVTNLDTEGNPDTVNPAEKTNNSFKTVHRKKITQIIQVGHKTKTQLREPCSNDAEVYLSDQVVTLCGCHPEIGGALKSRCLSSCLACNQTDAGPSITETSDLVTNPGTGGDLDTSYPVEETTNSSTGDQRQKLTQVIQKWRKKGNTNVGGTGEQKSDTNSSNYGNFDGGTSDFNRMDETTNSSSKSVHGTTTQTTEVWHKTGNENWTATHKSEMYTNSSHSVQWNLTHLTEVGHKTGNQNAEVSNSELVKQEMFGDTQQTCTTSQEWVCDESPLREGANTQGVFFSNCLDEGYGKIHDWKKRCGCKVESKQNCKNSSAVISPAPANSTKNPQFSSQNCTTSQEWICDESPLREGANTQGVFFSNCLDEGYGKLHDWKKRCGCKVESKQNCKNSSAVISPAPANRTKKPQFSSQTCTASQEWICNEIPLREGAKTQDVFFSNCLHEGYGKLHDWKKRCGCKKELKRICKPTPAGITPAKITNKPKESESTLECPIVENWICNSDKPLREGAKSQAVFYTNCLNDSYGENHYWKKRCGCKVESKKVCNGSDSNNGTNQTAPIERNFYDCSKYELLKFTCKKAGLFSNPKDLSMFFHCKTINGRLVRLCYACNAESKSCFDEARSKCVPNGCKEDAVADSGSDAVADADSVSDADSVPNESKDEEETPISTLLCSGYKKSAIPCANLMKETSRVSSSNFMFAHLGDKRVYFQCFKNRSRWGARCHTCPLSTCFLQEKQACRAEYCDKDDDSILTEDIGPYRPYDCRFYQSDSFPCSEVGTWGNPVDTSIYFTCMQDANTEWKAVCHACHNRNTCFIESSGTCLISSGSKCGTVMSTASTINRGIPYDCSGYDADATFPCEQREEVGLLAIPGDKSVYWMCSETSDGEYYAICQTCDEKSGSCFVESSQTCVEGCSPKPHRPYDCSAYFEDNSFDCAREGFYAQTFDSSIFFKCVQLHGSIYRAECFQCNKQQNSCFSNRIGRCIHSKQQCGNSDPVDIPSDATFSVGYDCLGYNEFAVPCKYLGEGVFGSPGDPTVYFTCAKDEEGKWVATCTSCSRETKSYFIQSDRKCVENQGLGPSHPYSCASYGENYFDCKKEGLFANPLDPSVYFRCVKVGGRSGWKSFCYTCDRTYATCFDNLAGTCIDNDYEPCPPLVTAPAPSSTDDEDKIIAFTEAYDCSGYNDLSFPCKLHGPGMHGTPSDRSIYFECFFKGTKPIAKCHVCPKATKSCFSESAKHCVNYCIEGSSEPYKCDFRSFKCHREGIFADPNENSVFYKCVKTDGSLQAQCFTCSNRNFPRTICFSQKLQACITTSQKTCGRSDPAELDDPGSVENSRTYSCLGYHSKSFPCEKYAGYSIGKKFGTPGDQSVFFTCQSDNTAVCAVCRADQNSVFDEEKQKCLENGGIGPKRPYDCSVHDHMQFAREKCRKYGYFATSDTSVFFKCVKGGNGHWEAHCHTCSSKKKTCWSNTVKACVTNPDRDACGSSDPYLDNDFGGNEEISRTYDCAGYSDAAFPCSRHMYQVYKHKHVHPGDKSVYFSCLNDGNGNWKAQCYTCSSHDHGCFVQHLDVQECRENCGKGLAIPYDCSYHHYRSYDCKYEGGYFANPGEVSTYFLCKRSRGVLFAYCFSCSKKSKEDRTCFSNELQACISVKALTSSDECGPIDPISLPRSGSEENSRTYDCEGYLPSSFPCERYQFEGKYAMPGDKSVFFECKLVSGVWKGKCSACPNGTCFEEARQDCTRSCTGSDDNTKSYLCERDSEYPCTQAGVFAHSYDSSIYFKCYKNDAGLWRSSCFTCNQNKKTCFSNQVSACLTSSSSCDSLKADPATLKDSGNEKDSRSYSCTGYTAKSFPCSAESQEGQKYEKPGDKSVYYECSNLDGIWIANCIACRKETESCFVPAKQKCVEQCGKGPRKVEYKKRKKLKGIEDR